MEELLQNLKRADEICKKANVHYENANRMEQAFRVQTAGSKNTKIKWAAIGFGVYFAAGIAARVVSGIPFLGTALAGIIGIGGLIAGVYVGLQGYQKEKSDLEAKIEANHQQAENERAVAQKIFEEYTDEMAFLPVDYWYPMATEYLIKMVQSQRADSLKEALNLYDEQLHRWKVEEANNNIMMQQQIQTAHLASIKTSSKISAAANVTNTLFHIASKL